MCLLMTIYIYIYIYINGSQTWPIKWNAVSSKQRSCQYCCMGALDGLLLNVWRKKLTATTQECCEQYWTSPGGSTPQSNSCTATYHPYIYIYIYKQGYKYRYMYIMIKDIYLPNPSARAGYDSKLVFKQSLTGLNSEFSLS